MANRKDRSDFLVFGAPRIERDEIEEVLDSIEKAWIGTGPKVGRFEEQFRTYVEGEHAIAVSSCTAALHLSMQVAGVGPGDEVITTALTFCATVNAIIHSGATPVIADVDPETMNIDPADVEAKITSRTRAIIPVHFAGRPCDMDALTSLADKYDLLMIEDCAHAIETTWRGRHAGTFGQFGCFSFYVTKNVMTGEGGMIITSSEKDAARIKRLALHGMSKDAWKRYSDEGYRHYRVVECGYKYNMTDLQAAFGLRQLEKVDRYWNIRRSIWEKYMEAFRDLPVALPAQSDPRAKHACHLFTVLIDEKRCGISRDTFLQRLHERKIGTGVHYIAIPEHPFYQETYGWTEDTAPNAVRIGRQTVSLPLSARLSDEDVGNVIDAVHGVLTDA